MSNGFIGVKCLRADGGLPLTVEIPPEPVPTVGVLRSAFIRESGLDPETSVAKLIYAGARIVDDNAELPPGILAGNATVHFSISERKIPPQDFRETSVRRRPWEESQILVQADRSVIPALMRTGLTAGEVSRLPTVEYDGVQMLVVPVGPLVRGSSGAHESEEDELISSSQWTAAQSADVAEEDSEFATAEEGTFHDFCWGVVVGLLLGLIAVVLSMDRSMLLSRRFYTGIVAGTGLNLWISLTMLISQNSQMSM